MALQHWQVEAAGSLEDQEAFHTRPVQGAEARVAFLETSLVYPVVLAAEPPGHSAVTRGDWAVGTQGLEDLVDREALLHLVDPVAWGDRLLGPRVVVHHKVACLVGLENREGWRNILNLEDLEAGGLMSQGDHLVVA